MDKIVYVQTQVDYIHTSKGSTWFVDYVVKHDSDKLQVKEEKFNTEEIAQERIKELLKQV